MGAQWFDQTALAKTAHAAFNEGVEAAAYDYGHSGYTGTLAEKPGFVMLGTLPARVSSELATRHLEDWSQWREHGYWMDYKETRFIKRRRNPLPNALAAMGEQFWNRVVEIALGDKWGPAACFQLNKAETKQIKEWQGRKGSHDKAFVFFGYASS